MSKKIEPGSLLSRRELASAMGVTMSSVTKWEQDGLPISTRGRKGKPSLYRMADVLRWRAEREAAARSPGAPVDLARERATKESWQGKLAQQQFLVRERLLVPAEEMKAVMQADQTAIKGKLLAVPVQYADKIARAVTLLGVAGAEAVLKEMVHDILRELSDPAREPKPAPEGNGEAQKTEAA